MTQRMELSPTEIVRSRFQTRQDGYQGESFEGLVSSVKRHGLINPLGVIVNESNEFELVYGHRRLEAARKAQLKTLPVDVIASLISTDDVAGELDKIQEMVLVDNLFHEDLTALEVARGLQELIRLQGLSQEQVAQVVGKSQQWVSDKLRLLDLAEPVKKAVTGRSVEETVARRLATLPENMQESVLEYVKGKASREANEIIGEIKEATDPEFWDLPEDKPWEPEKINVKAMLDDCLDQVPPEKKGEALVNLQARGLLKGPGQQYAYSMGGFPSACGLKHKSMGAWQKAQERTCEHCVWQGEHIHYQCGQERETCESCLIETDEVRLPVPCGETEADCQACEKDPGWCTDVACYIEHCKAVSREAEAAVDEAGLERDIEAQEALRAFYDRQTGEGITRDHWLAQACEYCALWRGPEQRDQCNAEKPQHIQTGFWQSEGVTVPRCTGFGLRNLARVPEIDQARFEEILLVGLDELRRMGSLRPRGIYKGGEDDDFIATIKEAGLNKRQLVALWISAINSRVDGVWGGTERSLINPITGEKTIWLVIPQQPEDDEDADS
ncbi:MAG TPA: ParB/RepB/Spo0J family partition protein [Anaerolineae bacterium]|nr:ParB/RepB/Spo0J family partition protein [Anaerolineae bacterium]